MSAPRRVIVLTLVLATVALAVVGVSLATLYGTAMDGQRQRLVDTAAGQARLIEAVARFDAEHSADFPGGAWAATLDQLRQAYGRAPGLGETGEVLVGHVQGDRIVFALQPRHAQEGAPVTVPLDSELAQPMRRALRGEAGHMEGPDYRGEMVLAAYEPLEGLDAGVVAKLDLAEIRAPFVQAGVLAGCVALLLIILGTAATYRIGGTMASEILRLEDLRRMADEQLRLAVEGAGLGLWEVDFEAGAWNYSDQLRERLGYGPGQMDPTLEQWEALLHPDDVPSANRHKDTLARGEDRRYEAHYRLRSADGTWLWIHSLGTLVDPEGRRAVGVHRDVTSEQEMLETLQRSEERLSGIVQALPGSLVAILDRDLRYVYAAGEALEMVGLGPEDLLGHEVGTFLDGAVAERSRAAYLEVLEGTTVDFELGFRDRTFMVRGSPIRGRDGEVDRILSLATDISERKERERLLHRQREQLDRIIEGIPRAVVAVLDRDLRIEFLGGEAVANQRRDVSGRVGTSVMDWIDPEGRPHIRAFLDRALAGEQVRLREVFPGRFHGGDEPIPLEISAGPLRGPDGTVQAILALAVDVSEEWEARQALEATRERLELALQAGQHGIYDLDVATGVIEVDDLYATMLGYDPEGFQDTLERWAERLHPDDRASAARAAEAFASGAVDAYHSEFRQRTASGGWVWIRSVARAVARDEHGRPTRVMGTHTDITQEKEAERTRELLSTAVERSSSLVLITDGEGLVEYANPEFERVTGWDGDEVLGRDVSFLRSEHHDDAFHKELEDRIRRGESFETELVNRKKDGSEYRQQTLVTPILGGDGQVRSVVTIGRDVTTERALEEQLRQAQKMEAVGQLTGGIAHDFNNVLTGILSNVHLALDALPEDARELRDELQEVRKAAEHGAAMVRKLMAFSRDRHLDLEPLEMSGFLEEARDFLARILPETVRLELDDGTGGAVVELDAGAMQQILLNLATNARDAMPHGGTLRLVPDVDREAGRWTLEVVDQGGGMAPDVAERVFEPFFTTKGDGTGLGLSMVYALTERQGGSVAVETEPGAGTTFRVSFPLSGKEPARPVEDEGPVELAPGHGTILVVEDERAVRRAAQRILERAGYRVRLAEDGLEGLEILWNEGEEIDLVLSDVIMPGMGGADLWKAASAQDPHPPFLFTSGYADRDLEEELGGASRFLRKPWDGPELLAMVQKVLREEAG